MAYNRYHLSAALKDALAARARADERFKELSQGEIQGAEDPIALQDMERDLDALRHEIAKLDVEVTELERKLDGSLG